MSFPLWFFHWVVAFLVVLAALSILAALQEWRAWRRENR